MNEDIGQREEVKVVGVVCDVPYLVVERGFEIPDASRVVRMLGLDKYYCGYAKVPIDKGVSVPREGDVFAGQEITYGPDERYWVGFDTMHYGLRGTDLDTVEEMTKKFAIGIRKEEYYG